jgi:hypothetical protein
VRVARVADLEAELLAARDVPQHVGAGQLDDALHVPRLSHTTRHARAINDKPKRKTKNRRRPRRGRRDGASCRYLGVVVVEEQPLGVVEDEEASPPRLVHVTLV